MRSIASDKLTSPTCTSLNVKLTADAPVPTVIPLAKMVGTPSEDKPLLMVLASDCVKLAYVSSIVMLGILAAFVAFKTERACETVKSWKFETELSIDDDNSNSSTNNDNSELWYDAPIGGDIKSSTNASASATLANVALTLATLSRPPPILRSWKCASNSLTVSVILIALPSVNPLEAPEAL